MNYITESGATVEQSSVSHGVEGPNNAGTAMIPVYSVSDSDEERASALMRDMSASLQASVKAEQPTPSGSQDPDIMITESVPVVDLSDEASSGEAPSVQVMFMNTDIGRKYRHDIEEFFHTLMTADSLSKNKEPLPRIQRRPNLKPPKGEVSDSGVVAESTVIGAISVRIHC